MYGKLAIANTKKSIKDYLIYFITITLCVSLFYAFMSLSSSEYELITEDTYNFKMLQNILKYATVFITALLAILIAYVTKYMMKRRQKEFSLYILLGTEQKDVAFLFFIETFIIGTLAVILGIFLGTFFSQVVTAFVLLTAKQEIVFHFRFYWDTIGLTFLFFLSMFCIIGLYSFFVLKNRKLIQMLHADKKSEFQFKRSSALYAFLFIISLILYSICGYYTYHLLQSNDIISSKLSYVLIAFITFILATYAFFYCLAYILTFIKERWITFKYEGTNLFLIGVIASKLKTAPILMATISLSFLGAAISFIATLVMSQWSLGYLDYRVPFDISIASDYYIPNRLNITDKKDIPNVNYKELITDLNEKFHEENNDLESYCTVEKYFIHEKDFNIKDQYKMPFLAISLSDFNQLRAMLGYEEITLSDTEYTTQWHSTTGETDINKFLHSNSTLTIGQTTLKLNKTPLYQESIGEGIYNFYTEAIIILPDNICKQLTLASTDFYANTKKEMSYDTAMILTNKIIPNWIGQNYGDLIQKYDTAKGVSDSYFMNPRIKVLEQNTILNTTLGMRILGIYLGVVLLMISLTVLALQQLTDSIEHKKRFVVLSKLGIEQKEIRKIILKQISIYFIIPIFIAMIGVIVFIYNLFGLYAAPIKSYIGYNTFLLNIIVAILLMFLIYLCYYIATYFAFKRNVSLS